MIVTSSQVLSAVRAFNRLIANFSDFEFRISDFLPNPFFVNRYLPLILIFCLAPLARAAQPWILAFPEISFDDRRVYFCGEKWCGYLSTGLEAMLTLPRDSVAPPPPPIDYVTSEYLYGNEFTCDGGAITLKRPATGDTVYTFPEPGLDAVKILTQTVPADKRSKIKPQEVAGPITVTATKLFFGLTMKDQSSSAVTGGIGWLDPLTGHIGRAYTPALRTMESVWIGAVGDTVHALFAKTRNGKRVLTKWVRCSASAPELYETDLATAGIPGEIILNMQRWNDTIVLSTDEAIAIYRAERIEAWTTRTYAPIESDWLYMRKFASPGIGDTVRFLSIPKGRPTVVKAWINGWAEVGAPDGVQAIVSKKAWVADSSRWTKSDWECSKPCFARVRIPSQGGFIEGDLTDTPLTLLGVSRNGAQIGFRAGWIPARRLVPVLLPVR